MSSFLSVLTLASHILFVLMVLALIFRQSWGRGLATWLGRHVLSLAFAVSLFAVLGSLYYSNIVGFEPCVLCWWQRVFLFPLPIIFGTALLKKNTSAFLYAIPLIIFSAVVAAYQSYANLSGTSILPCTAVGAACSKIYVLSFGYITIPMMSLTIALYLLLFAWAKKVYENDSYAR